MGGIAKAIFGDKGAERQQKEAAARVQADAEKSRQMQMVANDRQLAVVAADDEKIGATRKAPRGRRLFETSAADGGLASTLGG